MTDTVCTNLCKYTRPFQTIRRVISNKYYNMRLLHYNKPHNTQRTLVHGLLSCTQVLQINGCYSTSPFIMIAWDYYVFRQFKCILTPLAHPVTCKAMEKNNSAPTLTKSTCLRKPMWRLLTLQRQGGIKALLYFE